MWGSGEAYAAVPGGDSMVEKKTAGVRVGRKYSTERVRAYECELDCSGKPVRKLRYVTSWYRMFHEGRLKVEFMPKLAEYAKKGRRYPFLLTEGRLEGKTDARLIYHPPQKRPEIEFAPRRADPRFEEHWLAIVLSETDYKLLPLL
jgi:hypothetical protein